MKSNCRANKNRGRFTVFALVVCTLLVSKSACFAQGKDAVQTKASGQIQLQQVKPSARLFSPPELKTHALPSRPEDVNTQATRQAQVFTSRIDPLNDTAQEAKFRQIVKEDSLRPTEQVPTTAFERKVENAFRPEILHVGHVKIYSPIATAIARKNPLCLLDPMVLGISF